MGAAANIRAGKAYAELGVKDKTEAALQAFKKRIMGVGTAIRDVGKQFMAVGSAGVGGLLAASGVFAKMGGDMLQLSQRTGVSVEALSELNYALTQSNSDIGSLETGVRAMQKALEGVNEEGEATKDVFSQIGLSVAELKAMSPDMQFEKIADAISRLPTASERTAAAMKIFGKSATGLLPAMLDGSRGIQDLRGDARKKGLVISEADARAADQLGDAWSELLDLGKAILFQVGAALGPSLITIMRAVGDLAVVTIEWLKANKGTVVTVAAVIAGVLGLGAALYVAGTAVAALGVAFGLVVPIIAAIFTPLGLLVAIAGGFAYALLGMINGFEALHTQVSSVMSSMAETVKTAFGGISDALKAGNIAIAGKILWASLKQLWIQGTNELMAIWRDWQAQVAESVDALFGRESKVQPRTEEELAAIKRLQDAQAELDALRAEAADAAAKAEADRAASVNGAKARVGGIGTTSTLTQAGAAGDFSARGFYATFAGGDAETRTAAAAEKLVDLADRIDRKLSGVLTFGG
jgi:hypothetical protein